MIHGHTEIVLKTKHGRVDRVHSDNTFQSSILAEGLRDLGYAGAGVLSRLTVNEKQEPFFSQLVGGLFLFKNTIPANSQFMNSGNQMIGNGAYGVTNSGDPNELGSYNSLESIVSSGMIRQVYDFSTAQANGEISSVCLTSQRGGYIGYGNASIKRASTLYDLWGHAALQEICPQASIDNSNVIVCNGKLYDFTLVDDGENLVVKKYRTPIKNASLFDGVLETVTIDVSDLHYSQFWGEDHAVSASSGKIYLSNASRGIVVGTYYLWEYDPSDDSITEITITSPLDFETIRPIVAQDKVFMQRSTGGPIVFNLDGSQFDIIQGEETGGLGFEFWVGDFGNGVLCSNFRDTGISGTSMYYYDIQNKTLRPINMDNLSGQMVRQDEDSKALTHPLLGAYYGNATAYNNPLYLATINNLATPVTKDSTMSMKVIYTLEEA